MKPVPIVSVYVGSIVSPEHGAHAIVNASNPEVRLGSGVTAAIREACGGQVYQSEILERWEEEFGEPMVTVGSDAPRGASRGGRDSGRS